MKIEVIKGKVDNHEPGKVIEVDDKNAARLIKLGYAKKADAKSGAAPSSDNTGGDK